MPSYYDSNKATLANARSLHPSSNAQQHFPEEGLYLGELTGGSMELPALFDLTENRGFCILYNNENDRKRANTSLERLEGYADPNLTICDTQRFDSFYQQLTTQLQSEFGYESDRHRYHTGAGKKNIARRIGGGTDINAFILRTAFKVTVWDDRNIAIAKTIAENIKSSFGI